MPDEKPTTDLPKRLLLVGASTRAAAFSAWRSGMEPVCVDLFGDLDLRDIAEVHTLPNLKAASRDAVKNIPTMPWLYVGGMENRPRLVDTITRTHPLLGNAGGVLRAVRNPIRVCEVLRNALLPALNVRTRNNPPPNDGNWLLKPRRSAGGRAIVPWDKSATRAKTLAESHYFQERKTGTPVAALYLASCLSCRLVGITRQLVGERELNATPFAYCGSVGPLNLPDDLSNQIKRVGRVLADEFRLRGLFGVDFQLTRDAAWPVEVNPRYPASAEVLEYSLGLALIRVHSHACASFGTDTSLAATHERSIAELLSDWKPGETSTVGKAVLFAGKAGRVAELPYKPPPQVAGRDTCREMADIPAPGTRLNAGDPICTVFSRAETVTACLNRLFQNARGTYRTVDGMA